MVVGVTSSSVTTRALPVATELPGHPVGTFTSSRPWTDVRRPRRRAWTKRDHGVDTGSWLPVRRTGRLNHLRQRAIAGRVPVSIHSVPRERDASFALHRRPMPISSWWGHVPKGRPQLPAEPRAMLDRSPCAVLVAWRAGYSRKACGVRQCNAVLIGRCRTTSADERRSSYQGRPRAEDSGSGSRSSTAYTTTGC